jgi:hypothetical protein
MNCPDLTDRIADLLMTGLALDGTPDERDWADRFADTVVKALLAEYHIIPRGKPLSDLEVESDESFARRQATD